MSENYDVVIVGCGISGLYAALNLPSKLNVLIICKREISLCNSMLAQGGIAGVYNSNTDNIQHHQNDTLIAGGFKNNVDAVYTLVSEAAQNLENIIKLGVNFDKNPDGTYHLTLEGGHNHHRIFHHVDSTGKEITTILFKNICQLSNVTIRENTIMCTTKKTSTGYSALLKDVANNKYSIVNCHFMVIATGGIGRIYQFTTNSVISTGDGITFAYEMGAKIKNLSYIQFHPTAFNNHTTRECFLISEAVRGEGAYLLNCKKKRFMHNYDERLELAPRDIVSNSIITESKKQNSNDFYLDISYKNSKFLKKRFPMIYKNLLSQGYDLTKEPVPIFPCQHYLMGGIDVDKNSETILKNLYACGECSHTGVHGRNRLASNSLLEALVFSRRAAKNITFKLDNVPKYFEDTEFNIYIGYKKISSEICTEIRKIMQNSYFVVKNKSAAAEGLKRIENIKNDILNGKYIIDVDYVLAKSIITVAYIILNEIKEN